MSMIPAENTVGITIVVLSAIFGAISILFFGLRLWSHRIRNVRADSSDWVLFVALLLALGLIGGTVNTVVQGLGMEDESKVPAHKLIELSKGLIVGIVLWVLSSSAVRVSILLLYKKLFDVHWFKLACWGMIAANAVYVVITLIVTFTICQPFSFNWNKYIPGGHCGNQTKFYLWMGIWNLLSDVSTVLMPMPILWGLQMPLRKKLGLSAIFGLGLLVCALTLVRIVQTSQASLKNTTRDYASIGILSLLEPLLGIVTACMPFLGPIVQHFSKGGSSAKGSSGSCRHDLKQHGSGGSGSAYNPTKTIGSTGNRSDFQKLNDMEMDLMGSQSRKLGRNQSWAEARASHGSDASSDRTAVARHDIRVRTEVDVDGKSISS